MIGLAVWVNKGFISTQPFRTLGAVFSCSVVSDSLWPARLLCPWGFSRQEYWSGLPCPPPGDLPSPEIKPRSTSLRADSLPSEPPGKPIQSPKLIQIWCHHLPVWSPKLAQKKSKWRIGDGRGLWSQRTRVRNWVEWNREGSEPTQWCVV